MWPSLVLCRSYTSSETRTGWRVVKQLDGRPTKNLPKVLVTSMAGHEDMIDYLSTYRIQYGFKKKIRLFKGAMFWFTCNQYGDFTGSCYFVKTVPDQELLQKSFWGTGYRKIIKKEKKTLSLLERLNHDDRLMIKETKKPTLIQ